MIKKLKNIKPRMLLTHVVISMGYPAVRALLAQENRLMLFTDALTIVGLILLVVGIIYAMILHGDFDISTYLLQRGLRSFKFGPRRGEAADPNQSPQEFLQEAREKRADAFNYPLFLGILYVLVSVVIAFCFLS